MHVAESGAGPLVLLLHGFPEGWYSWRHQLVALAEAGFHAVAPDQRGYGRTSKPSAVADYTMLHLVGDVVGLVDALGEDQAVVVGHDWGAAVAWHTALLRPDRVRGVAGLSVPFRPRGPVAPLSTVPSGFYLAHFQEPGVADAELAADPRDFLQRILYGASGDAPERSTMVVPPGGTFVDIWPRPDRLPGWLTAADLDTYAGEFADGFTGGLNWYRNLDRNWELTAAWHSAKIQPRALFMIGDRDPVLSFNRVDTLAGAVPNLARSLTVAGAGHWIQQERPDLVSGELAEFAASSRQ
ncbi:epoxide hydrolase [Kibdelosporangium phytohabitans]|uniref:Epoxide hydrolase n=2 Tax=Kibdelosporangium phytohabitans TaxID=860235 RepID=A0A0N9I5V8_9PSEU|nr:alpha/beta hydrolase [Kibdelosporangium phytohabitans]ALG15480.1 epoxide hydrolase [Kibdelosporangium phytohabitans]